jgi:hypothetical protein
MLRNVLNLLYTCYFKYMQYYESESVFEFREHIFITFFLCGSVLLINVMLI